MGFIISNTKHTERQGHAYAYEDYVIERYNFRKEPNYLSEWDAYTEDGTPVQIKMHENKKSLHLSGFENNMNRNRDFLLIEGIWEYNQSKEKQIIQENIYLIPIKFWKKQFPERESQLMLNIFNGIDNTQNTDSLWKYRLKQFKDDWNTIDSIITPYFKRDKKGQKRIQCGVNYTNQKHLQQFKIN